jgi:hypothetical protein
LAEVLRTWDQEAAEAAPDGTTRGDTGRIAEHPTDGHDRIDWAKFALRPHHDFVGA